MSRLTTWVALTLAAVLAVLAGGWFLLVSPERAEAAELRAQAEQQHSTNDALATRIDVLKAQAVGLPAQQAALAAVAAKIPADPAIPTLLRSLSAAAASSDVEFVSLVPGAVLSASPAAAAPAPAEDGTPAPVTPAAPTVAGGLSTIPVTINVVGSFYSLERYLGALEDLPRALRVTKLAVTPGENPVAPGSAGSTAAKDGSSLTAAITGEVFVSTAVAAPGPAAPSAGTNPSAPVTTGPVVPAVPPAN